MTPQAVSFNTYRIQIKAIYRSLEINKLFRISRKRTTGRNYRKPLYSILSFTVYLVPFHRVTLFFTGLPFNELFYSTCNSDSYIYMSLNYIYIL